MAEYTIHSSNFFYAPGFVPWLVNVYRTAPGIAFDIAASAFPEMPFRAGKAFLAGEVDLVIDHEAATVTFTA